MIFTDENLSKLIDVARDFYNDFSVIPDTFKEEFEKEYTGDQRDFKHKLSIAWKTHYAVISTTNVLGAAIQAVENLADKIDAPSDEESEVNLNDYNLGVDDE